jgi:hypothetical protein
MTSTPCIRVLQQKQKLQKSALKDNLEFMRKHFSHHQAHTLRHRREWASSDNLYLRVPVGNPALISLDLPRTALVVIERRRKILTYTQMIEQEQSLSDYAQQDLSVVTRELWN